MDYRAHLDREDKDIITIDTDSIDSEINYKVLTPLIDDNVVVELLKTDSVNSIGVIKKESKRKKIKDLFRSFSWKNKSKNTLSSTGSNDNLTVHNSDSKIECLNSDQFSFSESPIKSSTESSPQSSPNKSPISLYDNSKPMLYLSNNETSDEKLFNFLSEQESHRIPPDKKVNESLDSANNSLILSKTRDCVETENHTSPKRSLSRKFSTFSFRSKPNNNLCININSIDLTNADQMFIGESELTNWRIHEKSNIKLILGRENKEENEKSKKANNNNIFLFVSESPNTKNDEISSKRIDLNNEKLLYYPFTKKAIEKYYLQKGNNLCHSITEDLLKINSFPEFPMNDEYFDPKIQSKELAKYDIEKNRKIDLNIKSLKLQQSLEYFNSTKNLQTTNVVYQKYRDPVITINSIFNSLDLDNYVRLLFDNPHFQPYKKWKLWIEVKDKTNKLHKKFNVFTVISEYSQILKIQNKFDTFLNVYVQEKNQQLYILKEDELPIFHGKHKIKSYGEYVFVILTEDSKDSWNAVIELLTTEKFNSTSVGYEVIGICWRKYNSKTHSGFYLTLYVDDRLDFDPQKINLFLSDIRLFMPILIKHCFKKCKTFFPGEKHVQILDVA